MGAVASGACVSAGAVLRLAKLRKNPDYAHLLVAHLLVRCGIDAISVNIDVVDRTRRLVAAADTRLLLESARRREKETS